MFLKPGAGWMAHVCPSPLHPEVQLNLSSPRSSPGTAGLSRVPKTCLGPQYYLLEPTTILYARTHDRIFPPVRQNDGVRGTTGQMRN